jgi:molybdopterin converting factor subunit 1
MQVTIRLFAALAEITGTRELSLDMPEGASAADVFERLVEAYPRLRAYDSRVLFAVNASYADAATRVGAGESVAIIPPVSGGASGSGQSRGG